jgi:hypothetical protein
MKHKWNFQSCVIQSRYYISELCSNFNNMSDKSKFYYLFVYIITHEDLSIINIFGKCIIECLETRKLKQGL